MAASDRHPHVSATMAAWFPVMTARRCAANECDRPSQIICDVCVSGYCSTACKIRAWREGHNFVCRRISHIRKSDADLNDERSLSVKSVLDLLRKQRAAEVAACGRARTGGGGGMRGGDGGTRNGPLLALPIGKKAPASVVGNPSHGPGSHTSVGGGVGSTGDTFGKPNRSHVCRAALLPTPGHANSELLKLGAVGSAPLLPTPFYPPIFAPAAPNDYLQRPGLLPWPTAIPCANGRSGSFVGGGAPKPDGSGARPGGTVTGSVGNVLKPAGWARRAKTGTGTATAGAVSGRCAIGFENAVVDPFRQMPNMKQFYKDGDRVHLLINCVNKYTNIHWGNIHPADAEKSALLDRALEEARNVDASECITPSSCRMGDVILIKDTEGVYQRAVFISKRYGSMFVMYAETGRHARIAVEESTEVHRVSLERHLPPTAFAFSAPPAFFPEDRRQWKQKILMVIEPQFILRDSRGFHVKPIAWHDAFCASFEGNTMEPPRQFGPDFHEDVLLLSERSDLFKGHVVEFSLVARAEEYVQFQRDMRRILPIISDEEPSKDLKFYPQTFGFTTEFGEPRRFLVEQLVDNGPIVARLIDVGGQVTTRRSFCRWLPVGLVKVPSFAYQLVVTSPSEELSEQLQDCVLSKKPIKMRVIGFSEDGKTRCELYLGGGHKIVGVLGDAASSAAGLEEAEAAGLAAPERTMSLSSVDETEPNGSDNGDDNDMLAAVGDRSESEMTPTFATCSGLEMTPTFATCSRSETTPTFATCSGSETTSTFATCSGSETTPTFTTGSGLETTLTIATDSGLETTPTFATCSGLETTPTFTTGSGLETTSTIATGSRLETTPTFAACSGLKTTPTFNTCSRSETTPTFATCSGLETTPTFATCSGSETTPTFATCSGSETTPTFATRSRSNTDASVDTCSPTLPAPARSEVAEEERISNTPETEIAVVSPSPSEETVEEAEAEEPELEAGTEPEEAGVEPEEPPNELDSSVDRDQRPMWQHVVEYRELEVGAVVDVRVLGFPACADDGGDWPYDFAGVPVPLYEELLRSQAEFAGQVHAAGQAAPVAEQVLPYLTVLALDEDVTDMFKRGFYGLNGNVSFIDDGKTQPVVPENIRQIPRNLLERPAFVNLFLFDASVFEELRYSVRDAEVCANNGGSAYAKLRIVTRLNYAPVYVVKVMEVIFDDY